MRVADARAITWVVYVGCGQEEIVVETFRVSIVKCVKVFQILGLVNRAIRYRWRCQ